MIIIIIIMACVVYSHSLTANWQISPHRRSLATLLIKGAVLQIIFRFLWALNPSQDRLELPCALLTFIMILQKSLTLQRQNVFVTVFHGGSQRAEAKRPPYYNL